MKTTFTISEIISKAWSTVKSQIWVLVGLLIGYSIINFTLSLFASYTSLTGMLVTLLSLIISCLFTLGYIKNIFQALDGEEPQFSAYGQESRKLLKFLAAHILYVIVVMIGFVLLILPGIYLAIRLQFYIPLIVDEDLGSIEALKRSWEMTKGHELSLFLLALTMLGITIVGLIVLVVGIFVAAPVIYTMYVIVYRHLNSPLNVLDEVQETKEI